MRKVQFFIPLLLLAVACNKVEGPGGTSTITGTVTVQDHESARNEITEIIISAGAEVEHGEYWIINTPIGNQQFYVYYDNPEWLTPADPGLSGRTGIGVTFNYDDSNVDIATNTQEALETLAEGYFTVSRNIDVLTIENKQAGVVADADEISSPFEFNVVQQGRYGSLSASENAIDQRVYIVYGDQTVYGETARTGGDGDYQFNNLTPGNYTVYAISKDTLTGGTVKVEKSISIADKKSVTEIDPIALFD